MCSVGLVKQMKSVHCKQIRFCFAFFSLLPTLQICELQQMRAIMRGRFNEMRVLIKWASDDETHSLLHFLNFTLRKKKNKKTLAGHSEDSLQKGEWKYVAFANGYWRVQKKALMYIYGAQWIKSLTDSLPYKQSYYSHTG